MWKYCIETCYAWMRDLNQPLWTHEHTEYTEQKYFRTKAEAKKAFAKEIRDVKAILKARREQVGNCHEYVYMRRYSDTSVFMGIRNRFDRQKPSEDQVVIRWGQVNRK